ncbi:MAG: hypothetical protein CMJ75_22870 [Planctomycetaceae bacterium]|nr:hypothetical protein [Planctomycetaceae bacterium]
MSEKNYTLLVGQEALNWALATGSTLNKFEDPVEGEAFGLDPDRAQEVAREDVGLLWGWSEWRLDGDLQGGSMREEGWEALWAQHLPELEKAFEVADCENEPDPEDLYLGLPEEDRLWTNGHHFLVICPSGSISPQYEPDHVEDCLEEHGSFLSFGDRRIRTLEHYRALGRKLPAPEAILGLTWALSPAPEAPSPAPEAPSPAEGLRMPLPGVKLANGGTVLLTRAEESEGSGSISGLVLALTTTLRPGDLPEFAIWRYCETPSKSLTVEGWYYGDLREALEDFENR